jgi:transposase
MHIKKEKKALAIKLRLEGKSYRDIKKELGVPKGTLSY